MKNEKKSKILIIIGSILVGIIIITAIAMPSIKLNYVKNLCNKEYEQKCNRLIKKYKKENSSFLSVDIYNPPVPIKSFCIRTSTADTKTDYGYAIFFQNKSGMKVKSVSCIYQQDGIAKRFRSSKEDEFFADENDTEEHIMFGQLTPSFNEEADYTETTIEFYSEDKGYITYIEKNYDYDVIKPSVHSWSNYYKDDNGYCMLITRDSSVNEIDVKAEDYQCEYSVETY